ncbi:MAG: TldD/PmbA family protein [Trueperaceae bacterium]|nr:TldD/PmbA family protein [Trueperaceae bacterium]
MKRLSMAAAHDFILKKAQADRVDAEILATEERKLTLESFELELSQITQATQGGLGIRVVSGGKTGYASTEEVTEEALDWVYTEAKENAELQSETGGFLPAGQNLGYKDLLSEGLSAPIEEKADAALELEKNLRSDKRMQQVAINRYAETETQVSLSSTQGAKGGYRNGYSALMASFIMREGDSLKQAFDFQLEKDFHVLEPGKTALDMIERVGRQLGASNLKTGRYTAYFEPKAFAQILGLVIYMLSAKSVMEGKSRLADKLGKQVASSLVNLIDDPDLKDGKANQPFDSEGTPTTRIALVENGILKSFFHNSHTAKHLGQANTGHAQRSYKATLGISNTNFFLEPGQGLKPQNGIIITDLMGVHAGANPISGDFSLQAFGLKVNAEATEPVENFVISGNLLDLLTKISGLGDTLEWNPFSGMIGSPMVEVQDLSFAGS